MDRDRRSESLLPLRPVEFHILLSLAGGERHGYGIIQDARERGEAVPDIGTLYRALARMVDQGLIEAGDRLPTPDTGEERRNCTTRSLPRVSELPRRRRGGSRR